MSLVLADVNQASHDNARARWPHSARHAVDGLADQYEIAPVPSGNSRWSFWKHFGGLMPSVHNAKKGEPTQRGEVRISQV